jgi:hypothetical protein
MLRHANHAHHQQQQQQQHAAAAAVHYVRVLYDGQPLRWQQVPGGALQSHWATAAAAAAAPGRSTSDPKGVTGVTTQKLGSKPSGALQHGAGGVSWLGRRPAAAAAGTGVVDASRGGGVHGIHVGEELPNGAHGTAGQLRQEAAAAGVSGRQEGTSTLRLQDDLQLQPEAGWITLEQLQDLMQPFAADRDTHARECKL